MGLLSRFFGAKEAPAAAPEQRAVTLTNSPWGAFVVPTATGLPVTTSTAMSIPAVYAAVSGVADTLATLPLPVYQAGEKQYKHPVYDLLNVSPNSIQTAKTWRAVMVSDLMTQGEHFSQIVRSNSGKPLAIWRVCSSRVRTEWDNSEQTLAYYVDNERFDFNDLIHVIYFTLDGFRGVSPFKLCSDSLSLTLALDLYGSRFFANGARPGGILNKPPGLSPEESEEARKQFSEAYAGVSNAGKTAVLPNGFAYTATSLAPEEGQMHESRTMQMRECQRITRVPPHIVADYERQTWSNIQYARMEFVQNSIRPIAIAIDQELNRKLLSKLEREECHIEHVLEGLLKGSFTEQMDYLTKGVSGRIYTPNEARAYLGLSPQDGGDQLNKEAATPVPSAPVQESNNAYSQPIK